MAGLDVLPSVGLQWDRGPPAARTRVDDGRTRLGGVELGEWSVAWAVPGAGKPSSRLRDCNRVTAPYAGSSLHGEGRPGCEGCELQGVEYVSLIFRLTVASRREVRVEPSAVTSVAPASTRQLTTRQSPVRTDALK